MAEEQKRTAAYVPWATFKNSLDQLAQGIPHRIDRSVFQGLAWNVQNQLFIALRFFGLLKGEDEPTQLLDDLVKGTEEERKVKLKKAVTAAYADLIAIDLTKATRSQFEEKLGELYSVTGDTRVKAVRFFLNVAEYVGIPLSSFILPQANGATNGPKRRAASRPRNATKKTVTPSPAPPITDPGKNEGEGKTIALTSGGALSVSATKSFFALNARDRHLYNTIVDLLEQYESESTS